VEQHKTTNVKYVVDHVALSMVRRVAAMLNTEAEGFAEGDTLPPCWHFPLLAGDTRRADLRADGFPGLGVPMPDFGLPRLLLVGRTIDWPGVLRIGDKIERSSALVGSQEKETASGRMVLVTLQHKLRPVSEETAAVIETQTYALLPTAPSAVVSKKTKVSPDLAQVCIGKQQLTPDETLLFQYSALGFNSHKIHLDRAYAAEVESLPDLVVNGGLSTLLAMEFLRNELGKVPLAVRVRHFAPLYCNRRLTLRAEDIATALRVAILDEEGALAATVEVEV
jgi:3-methylfumaryl-CoA hydratase